MMSTWPETIVFGHAELASQDASKTHFQQGKNGEGFWPVTQTSRKCCGPGCMRASPRSISRLFLCRCAPCGSMPPDVAGPSLCRSKRLAQVPLSENCVEKLVDAARRREIDVVLVWRLDRWGRSLMDLVDTLQELTDLNVAFVSLTEALDLTTSTGKAMAGMLAMFAAFEHDILRGATALAWPMPGKAESVSAGRQLQPSMLPKSGNCIVQASANPKSLGGYRSAAHRSAESWQPNNEETSQRPDSGRTNPRRGYRGRLRTGRAGDGLVLLSRQQDPFSFPGKVHRIEISFAAQEKRNRRSLPPCPRRSLCQRHARSDPMAGAENGSPSFSAGGY